MVGVVPAIHAVVQTAAFEFLVAPVMQSLQARQRATAWMAGASPAMTANVVPNPDIGNGRLQAKRAERVMNTRFTSGSGDPE